MTMTDPNGYSDEEFQVETNEVAVVDPEWVKSLF